MTKIAVKPAGGFLLVDRGQDEGDREIDGLTLVRKTGFIEARVMSKELQAFLQYEFPDHSKTAELRAHLKEAEGDHEFAVASYASTFEVGEKPAEKRISAHDGEDAPRDENGLRLDGPTPEEWAAAGYDPAGYPPPDYAPRETPYVPPAPPSAAKAKGSAKKAGGSKKAE